ncbi:hemolysin family protein [Chloroflexota bacterium]|jgi:putative hemolysin
MPLDLLLIFILILLNGFFAASEIAVVSAREVRLQTRAEAGEKRARRALRLQRKPGEFLATVQVGITLVATLASAVGGVEAARRIAPLLEQVPLIAPYAEQIALAIVVLAISYATLLLGELVPKRLAIRQPEQLAMSVAGFFEVMARIASWPIRFLLFSADLVMRLWGDDPSDDSISSEEIEVLVRRGTAQGTFLPIQQQMITRVFDYARRTIRDVMTPRTKIVAFEDDMLVQAALIIARESGLSRFPVYSGNLDQILGYVHVKDLFWASSEKQLNQIMREMVFIPEGASLPQVSAQLTHARRYIGIVLDEFGGTEGLVTLEDIMEVVVGEIEDEYGPIAEVPKRGQLGEWCLSGDLAIAEFEELTDLSFDPRGVFTTLAGFIMAELGKIPEVGDSVSYQDYCFTVEEMERFRILTVRVQQISFENDHQTDDSLS